MSTTTKKPPMSFRRAAMYAAPALAFAVAGVAFAGPLKTFAPNEVLTASDLNGNFSALQQNIDTLTAKTPVVTDWVPYDVVLTAGGTTNIPVSTDNASNSTGYWRRVGDSIEVRMDVKTPTCTASGGIIASLPTGLELDVAKSGEYAELGGGIVLKQGAGIEYVHVIGGLDGSPTPAVGFAAYEGTVTVDCSKLGSFGLLRVHWSSPIKGWTAFQ